ncbi:MAG: DUF779 domain-containing protein [Rhodopseudomonas palustris]|uniref:DUF779 domain-containing protein n=1 Tax=Rhodopseudomonas palustris TaxID=1076 RepID=A0A933VWY0_RHOPL|nr:DUF779 domain-containing protein [Rhodopseudomonas palustris]
MMFHQSVGCCDRSAPMCYPAGDFRLGPAVVQPRQFVVAEHTASSQKTDALRRLGGEPRATTRSSMINCVCFQYSNCDGRQPPKKMFDDFSPPPREAD